MSSFLLKGTTRALLGYKLTTDNKKSKTIYPLCYAALHLLNLKMKNARAGKVSRRKRKVTSELQSVFN